MITVGGSKGGISRGNRSRQETSLARQRGLDSVPGEESHPAGPRAARAVSSYPARAHQAVAVLGSH
jgi:hypothetical protein